MKKLSFLAVIAIGLLLGCSKSDDTEEIASNLPEKNASAASVTGEEIFRSFFFLQNGIESNVAELAKIKNYINTLSNKDQIYYDLDALADEVVTYVDATYPTYFNTLLAAVSSQDNYEITQSLNTGGLIIQQYMLSSQLPARIQTGAMNDLIINNGNAAEAACTFNLMNATQRQAFVDYMEGLDLNDEYIETAFVFYAVAAVVSIAAVVYSVVNWVVYWDVTDYICAMPNVPGGGGGTLTLDKQILIQQINDYYNQ